MRALDPRLLRYARSTRTFLYVSVALGSLAALLIVAQAWLLADVVAGAFASGKDLAALQTPMVALLCVVVARAAVAWGAELAAASCSATAKSQLRGALLERVALVGVDSSRHERTGELATLATRGIDALDGWFSLYLPQLLLAVIVPLAVLAAIFTGDWISGAIVALTIPLIPLFMALVGATTRERMDLQLRTLQRLAGHFLDVVAGLPTLKVFGRAKAQAESIRKVSERYRTTALSTLRVTFLSSLILELVATISVALVALAIGLRLMSGQLDLRTALFVLVLAPEAYLPLRRLGANYHASAEGMAAAEQVFAGLNRSGTPHDGRHPEGHTQRAHSSEHQGWAFAASATAIAATVGSIFIDLYPNVMVSSTNAAFNLTVNNSASGSYALTVMSIVTVIFFPLVLLYQGWSFYVFRARVKGPPESAPKPGAAAPHSS